MASASFSFCLIPDTKRRSLRWRRPAAALCTLSGASNAMLSPAVTDMVAGGKCSSEYPHVTSSHVLTLPCCATVYAVLLGARVSAPHVRGWELRLIQVGSLCWVQQHNKWISHDRRTAGRVGSAKAGEGKTREWGGCGGVVWGVLLVSPQGAAPCRRGCCCLLLCSTSGP